jgi:hypothetical protein
LEGAVAKRDGVGDRALDRLGPTERWNDVDVERRHSSAPVEVDVDFVEADAVADGEVACEATGEAKLGVDRFVVAASPARDWCAASTNAD